MLGSKCKTSLLYFLLVLLQFYFSLSQESESINEVDGDLEQFIFRSHYRQTTTLSSKPNTAALVRVIRNTGCFNRTIIKASADLVRANGISKQNAAAFLASNSNSRIFCPGSVSGGCPQTLAGTNVRCVSTYAYRSISGVCNNLQQPLLGAAERPFRRFLPPDYEDGVTLPRGFNRAVNPLPNPRVVSNAMVANPPTGPIVTTLLLMAWGQFMDHDLVLTPESATLDSTGEIAPISCCERNNQGAGAGIEDCLPIGVSGDPFFSTVGVNCLRFVRSLPTTVSCKLGQREQVNLLTSFVDASQVYGSSTEESNALRAFTNGLLVSNTKAESVSCPGRPAFKYLPEFTDSAGMKSFFAGDERVIEQPSLTSMHSLFLRIHNDLALKFKSKYPAWTDEKIYQESRRVVGALLQSITYGEFLPIVLGPQGMTQYGLNLLSSGFTNNYDPNIDPSTPNSFGIAFRFGHSLIRDKFILRTKQVQLVPAFGNNDVTQQPGSEPSDFLEGISLGLSELQDYVLVKSVTNKLFAPPPFTNGSDLYSLNIMRGRDHGLPGYNKWRNFCGLPVVTSFSGLTNIMGPGAISALQSVYPSVDEIDLFPGGVAEYPIVPNAILGPTLSCIIGKHFSNIKVGDRFWFESSTQPKPFTSGQLNAIRNTKISSLICRYSTAQTIQPSAMLSPNLQGNGAIPCSQFPSIPVMDQFGTLF